MGAISMCLCMCWYSFCMGGCTVYVWVQFLYGCTDCMGGYSNYVWLGVLTVWVGTVIMYGWVY